MGWEWVIGGRYRYTHTMREHMATEDCSLFQPINHVYTRRRPPAEDAVQSGAFESAAAGLGESDGIIIPLFPFHRFLDSVVCHGSFQLDTYNERPYAIGGSVVGQGVATRPLVVLRVGNHYTPATDLQLLLSWPVRQCHSPHGQVVRQIMTVLCDDNQSVPNSTEHVVSGSSRLSACNSELFFILWPAMRFLYEKLRNTAKSKRLCSCLEMSTC